MHKQSTIDTVIIPLHLPWERSADFLRQTALTLSKSKKVIIYLHHEGRFFLKPSHTKYPCHKNIIFYTPRFIIPLVRIRVIRKLNHILSFLILLIHLHLKKKSILLWLFDPIFSLYTPFCMGVRKLYDCVDDVQWHLQPEENLAKIAEEKNLIKSVNYFFVNSHTLFNLKKKIRKPNLIVPLGFDSSTFMSAKRTGKRNSKAIVYIGEINDRIDWRLLVVFIGSLPDYTFHFYATIQNTKKIIARTGLLKKFSNVNLYSSLSRNEIAKNLLGYKIGIIPYDCDQKRNLHSYPMKSLEYAYSGLHILSTCITELTLYPEIFTCSNQSTDWVNGSKQLIDKKADIEKNKKFAISNSWDNKVSVILNYIQKN